MKNAFYKMLKIDSFVKSLKSSLDVIPAKAGIQCFQIVLDACLRRHDGVSDFLRVCQDYLSQVKMIFFFSYSFSSIWPVAYCLSSKSIAESDGFIL